MGEPQHLTPLGKIPDGIDKAHEAAEAKHKEYIQQAVDEYKKAIENVKAGCRAKTAYEAAGHLGRAWVHGVTGFGTFWVGTGVSAVNSYVKVTFQTETFDVLRLGDSYFERNALGIAKNVLRILNLLPVMGEVGAALKKSRVLVQEAGTVTCSLVTLNNMLAETGQGFLRAKRFFLSIEEVARAMGRLERIKEFGAFAPDIQEMAKALRDQRRRGRGTRR